MTVSDAGGFTASSTFTVDNNTPSPVSTAISTPSTCDLANGSIDLSVTPPDSYTYVWSNGQTTEDIASVLAGTYSVTITSVTTGCSSTAAYTVTNDNLPITITGNIIPLTSCVTSNGAIDITPSPTGTYTFIWSNGAMTEDIVNLNAGSYTVTVSAGGSCIAVGTFIVSNNTNPPDFSILTSPATCGQNNGAIDLTLTQGGNYLFQWSTGNSTEDLSGIPAGNYSVTVTDILSSCTGTADIILPDDQVIIGITGTTMPNTQCVGNNGSIDILVEPAGVYTYLWSGGESTEDITGLPVGSYAVTVTLGLTCMQSSTFEVTEIIEPIQINGNITPNTSCVQPNGAIDVSVTPSGIYSYVWSNGEVIEDIISITAGVYSITVTAPNGCTASESFTVLNQNSNFMTSGLVIPNSSCEVPNGAIDLSVSPLATYAFIWSDSAITEDIDSLSSGSYTVTVIDQTNCSSINTFLVPDNTISPFLDANVTPAICGTNNGAIDLTVIPAINMIFVWSNGVMTEDLLDILPGNYSITVTDTLSGCKTLDTLNVPNLNTNFSSSAVLSPNTSCDSPNGAIDLTVLPTGAYTFVWSNGAIIEDLNNLGSGSYSVIITDNTSCSSTEMFLIIDDSPDIMITSLITPSSCGLNNGAIDLTISPTIGNTFIWSNGEITADLQNLLSGEYILTVTGTGGCSVIDTFQVNDQGLSITLQGIPTANNSCSVSNGSIDLSVIPNGVYTYLWSTGNTTQDVSALDSGTYLVTVSDSNGCSTSAAFTVDDLTLIPVIKSTIIPSTCGNNEGEISLTILPAGTYLYSWSTGATMEDLTSLAPGIYTVTVTGSGGCTSATTLEVTNSGLLFSLDATITDNTDCIGSNGSIDLTVTPAGMYTFLWSGGEITEDVLNLSSGTYSVSVIDQSGCSTASQYTVENTISPLLVEEVITPVLCGEANGSIDLDITPANGNSFSWSNGSTSEDLDNLLPGSYSVTITALGGCTWSSIYEVEGSEKIQITLETDIVQSGDQLMTIRAKINLPLTAIDTVIWLPESLFDCDQSFCLEQTITRPDKRTEITVVAIDTNGCLAQARLILEEQINPDVYIPNVFSPNADGVNDLFTVYGNKDVELILELQIFDRWGNQVFVNDEFSPNEENYGWNGSFRNAEMNPAVFAYWVRVRYTDGTSGAFKGDVTLIR